jgi:Flp pilus assembly protein TadD
MSAPKSAASGGACGSTLSPTDNTRLSGIEQLLNELGATSPQAQMIRAEALRRIDKSDAAQAIYQELIGSCLDGRAKHGLGLIAARSGQQAASLNYLNQARQALPTDPRIRNDLGYALLLAGQFDAAQFEFFTVLDLSPQDTRATHNLVLLTFRQGKAEKAAELAKKLGLDATTVDKLRQQAQTMGTSPLASSSAVSAASGTQP